MDLKRYSKSFTNIRLPEIRKINLTTYKVLRDELKKHKDKCDIFDWVTLLDIISKGNFSETAIGCISEKCKYKFVLKLTQITKDNKKVINNEIIALKALHNSPFFVNLYDSFECKTKKNTKLSVVIQELLGDSINKIIFKNKRLPKSFYFSVFKQTLRCIAILESKRINHNDIHFENMLVTFDSNIKNLKIKLIDFGGATGASRYKFKSGVDTVNSRKSKSGFTLGLDVDLFCNFILLYDDLTNSKYIPEELYNLCSLINDYDYYISAKRLLRILK